MTLVKEFLLHEFSEENIQKFHQQSFLRGLFKLNELNLQSNIYSQGNKQISNNISEDANETLQDEINLTDQLLISNEKNSGKSGLLNSELFVGNMDEGIIPSNNSSKDPRKRNNKNNNNTSSNNTTTEKDKSLNIELSCFDSQNLKNKVDSEEKFENIINIEEEIKIKELKGPVLFKQDSRVLENVMVWRRIKIIILSICMISGILFYGTLPIIVSFSSNK